MDTYIDELMRNMMVITHQTDMAGINLHETLLLVLSRLTIRSISCPETFCLVSVSRGTAQGISSNIKQQRFHQHSRGAPGMELFKT